MGVKSSLSVLSSLVEKCCIPCLLYASESVKWNISMMKSFENAHAQFFFKVFHTFDKSIVASCQFFMGILPIEIQIVKRKLKFLNNIIKKSQNCILRTLCISDNELHDINIKYSINNYENWNSSLWKYFERNFIQ